MWSLDSLSKNKKFVLNVAIPLLYLLPLVVAWFSPKNLGFGDPLLLVVALVAGGVGLGLWIAATLSLGKSLRVLPGADKLVYRGAYRYIRHPMYIGITLTLFGLLVGCGSTFGALYLFFVVIPLNIVRAKAEEEALVEKFGEKYRAYRARTWF